MIPIKDIIPPRTTPLVAIGILLLSSVVILVRLWLDLPQEQGAPYVVANLLGLWIFADNVEDRLGHGRFGALYLFCHGVGTLTQSTVDSTAPILTVLGTSGVAGVMGAYFVLYPQSRVLTFFPLPWTLLEVPAAFFLGLFFLLQLTGGMASLAAVTAGFVAGALLCLVLRRPVVW